MVCVSNLDERYPNAPEALRNFWKAPRGAYVKFLINSRGLLRYRFSKREPNVIGQSSIERLNDFAEYSMEEATRIIMRDRAYFESLVFYMPGEVSTWEPVRLSQSL